MRLIEMHLRILRELRRYPSTDAELARSLNLTLYRARELRAELALRGLVVAALGPDGQIATRPHGILVDPTSDDRRRRVQRLSVPVYRVSPRGDRALDVYDGVRRPERLEERPADPPEGSVAPSPDRPGGAA